VFGHSGGVEFLERHYGTGLEQTFDMIRADIGLGQAGGQGQGSRGEQSGQGFHGVYPFLVSCLSGARLTSAT
jgi:hypothetical protein